MAEVVVVAAVQGKAGQGDALLTHLGTLLRATHEQDAPVLYALHRSAEDPDRFMVLERWTDDASLDAHNAQPHLQTFLEATSPLLAEPLQVDRLTALPEGDAVMGRL